jgi:hypothetical protein
MHFTCRSFIGRLSNNSWSQYWENEPDDINQISRRGHLFGLISFNVEDNSDTSSLGHELIAEINEYYFSTTDTDTNAVTRLKSVLTDFASRLDYQFSNLTLVLAVVLDGRLHLATLNTGKCILHRGSTISPILSGQPTQVVSISGQLQNGDRLLLCTGEFFLQITWDKIKSLLALPQIQDLEESFLSSLYALDDQQGLAAVFIVANTDPLDTEEEVIDEPKPQISTDIPEVISDKPRISLFKKLFSRQPVYVSHHENINLSRRKKLNILFSLLVLVALFVSIFIGSRQNRIRQTENRYQELKAQAEIKLNNAKTVKKLDLNEALILGKEVKGIVDTMAGLKIHIPEVNQLRDQVNFLLSQTGSAESYTPETLFDTSIINNNLRYSQMWLSNNLLYLLDGTNGRIDVFDITRTSTNAISSGDFIKGATSIAVSNDRVYILNNRQISEVQKTGLIPQIDLSKQIENFETGLIQFWNGSLYLLSLNNQTNAAIWKFPPSASGFSAGQLWLKDKQTLPVDTTSLAINGKLWILSKNGTIAPYSLGLREEFKMSASQSLDNAANIVTSPDTELLAFSSSGNLIHVYQKDGQSPLLYNLGSRRISSLAIDPSGKYVYALCEDQKIYKISL